MSDDRDSIESARERQHERAERVESIIGRIEADFEGLSYPVSSEDLAVEYADQELDLPNETESLGDVFDRLVDEEFRSPEAVREAVLGELTGEAGGPQEANDERALDPLDDRDETSTE